MINIVEISRNVLARLSVMDYEKDGGKSKEQLIFPNKFQAKGDIKRISEQELRLLFIEEFKQANKDLFYSIETPTVNKYKFDKSYNDIKVDNNGQSASLDMCVFRKTPDRYERILNLEFKYKNTGIKNIAKDILKLMAEEQDGAFILLLNNTDKGTLCSTNFKRVGVFNKLYKSFSDFKKDWNNDEKCIHLIILSLKQEKLIYKKIKKENLKALKEIFFIDIGCGNIVEIDGNGWKVEHIINNNE